MAIFKKGQKIRCVIVVLCSLVYLVQDYQVQAMSGDNQVQANFYNKKLYFPKKAIAVCALKKLSCLCIASEDGRIYCFDYGNDDKKLRYFRTREKFKSKSLCGWGNKLFSLSNDRKIIFKHDINSNNILKTGSFRYEQKVKCLYSIGSFIITGSIDGSRNRDL